MSWSTPKTDWNGETVDGVYTGDRFKRRGLQSN